MQLLKLRYLQLKRDLGYWIFIIAIVVFYLVKEISKDVFTHAVALTAIFIFLLFSSYINRKDLNFIRKYFVNPQKNILINYNILAIPVSLALVVEGYLYTALLLHITVSIFPFIKFEVKSSKLLFISQYIPHGQFEWIAGMRKNFYLFVLLVLFALVLSPVKFFGILALFLLNSIFLGFYNFFEPLVMLNPEGLDGETLLKRKVTFFHKFLLATNIPLLVFNSILHPEIAWFNACFLGGFTLVASCTIYMKYANYKPNTEMRFQIDSLLLFASTIIPVLLPITFILSQSYKKKALENLSRYTDDNN